LNASWGSGKELRNLLAVLTRTIASSVSEVAAAYRRLLQEQLESVQAEDCDGRELGSASARSCWLRSASCRGAHRSQLQIGMRDPGRHGVRIGSTVYDGSVRGRLDRLKEELIRVRVRD